MADIRVLERDWKSGMGKVIADGCLAIVDADEAAQDARLYRIQEMASMENIDFNTAVSLLGMDQKLETCLSVPPLVVALGSNIAITTGRFAMSMDVSQHEEQATTVKSDTSVEASASGGFPGLAKASVKTTAKLGVSHNRKRSTDYRSTVDVSVEMTQAPPPEGLSLIVDALTSNTKRAMDINEMLVQRQADTLAGQAAEGGGDDDAG